MAKNLLNRIKVKAFGVFQTLELPHKVILLFVTAGLLYLLVYTCTIQYYRTKLVKEKNYVIATVENVKDTKSGTQIYFRYIVSGSTYKDTYKFGPGYSGRVGDFFWIQIFSKNPSYYIITDYALPACVKSAKYMDTIFNLPYSDSTLCK